MGGLTLRALQHDDLQRVQNWLNREHIKKWYEVPGLCTVDDWLSELKGRHDAFAFITHFIALREGHPIGFCQYYRCMDTGEDWYGEVSLGGTYSIDYLIGEEAYLGKGIGKALIALLVEKIFSLTDSKRIIVQPDKDNIASCHALLSNGFLFDAKNNFYALSK